MTDYKHTQLGNFVPPDVKPPRFEVLPADRFTRRPGISLPMPHSSHTDRAHGFALVTAPLAAATGVVVLLIGIVAFGVPVLSVVALLVALGGFTLTWLIAYIVHTFVSPDGALLTHVLLMWRYLFLEGKERRRRYGKR